MDAYNLDHLTKVSVFKPEESIYIEYSSGISFFGIEIHKKGFYNVIDGSYLGLKIPENLFIQAYKVMIKPRVTMRYIDCSEHVEYFDSMDEAYDFAKRYSKGFLVC